MTLKRTDFFFSTLFLFVNLKDATTRLFHEQPLGRYFPELEKIQNKVLSLSIIHTESKRVVAAGCQDGTVHLCVFSTTGSSADEGLHPHINRFSLLSLSLSQAGLRRLGHY